MGPLAAFLPLIIIGIVISLTVRTAEQKRRQEAQRRAAVEQQQTRQSVPPINRQQPQVSVRPSVQVPTPAREGPQPQERVQAQIKPRMPKPMPEQHKPVSNPAKEKHPEHELCALRPEEAHPQGAAHAEVSHNAGSLLDFTPDNILRGVLFSEVFGKPKALR